MKKNRKEVMRILKFALVFTSAIALEFGSFLFFEEVFHLDHWLSHLISIGIVTTFHFFINREFTFRANNKISVGFLLSIAFHVVFATVSTLWTDALTTAPVLWNEYLVKSLSIVLHFLLEYLYDRYIVFGKATDQKGQHHFFLHEHGNSPLNEESPKSESKDAQE